MACDIWAPSAAPLTPRELRKPTPRPPFPPQRAPPILLQGSRVPGHLKTSQQIEEENLRESIPTGFCTCLFQTPSALRQCHRFYLTRLFVILFLTSPISQRNDTLPTSPESHGDGCRGARQRAPMTNGSNSRGAQPPQSRLVLSSLFSVKWKEDATRLADDGSPEIIFSEIIDYAESRGIIQFSTVRCSSMASAGHLLCSKL